MSKQIKVCVGRDIKKMTEEANEFMKGIPENEVYYVNGFNAGVGNNTVMVVYHQEP